MLSCEASQQLMVDALYSDEPNATPSSLRQHLDECENCCQLFEQLQASSAELSASGIRDESFQDIPERASLDDLFDRLSPELDRIDAERYRQLHQGKFSPWSMAFGAVAASLIIFVTAFVFVSSNPKQPASTPAVAGVSPELMNYLNKAQVMLMQVANTEQEAPVLPIQRNTARDLASQASLLTAMDDDPFNSGEMRLLRDIEFMLLQIANLDRSNMDEGVALLQQFLEQNSILFRIRLLEMRNQDLMI